ncbi:MAG: response regulator [Candidatus Zixiibacteriota bacterium]
MDKRYESVAQMYRILIVDDDDDVRADFEAALKASERLIHVAAGANEAIPLLNSAEYHLVLLDKNMPNLSGVMDSEGGIKLFEHIRSVAPHTTCIVLTSHATAKTYEKTMEQGLYRYIDKGLTTSELAEIVEKTLTDRRVTVLSRGGMPEKMDILAFWGEIGTVVKTVDRTSSRAGIVKLASGEWQAEPDRSSQVGRIQQGKRVEARAIENGRIQIIPSPSDY